jgi:hypothetical protein
MSTPKEPNHFCSDLYKEADEFNNDISNFFRYRNKEDYLQLFKEAKTEKILGESSVHYLHSKTAPLRIKKEIQNPKIIISLRDPVKFIQSYHSQILGQSENIKNLKQALDAEQERIKEKALSKSMQGSPSFLYYRQLAHFSNFINYYFNIFDKKNIKIILLDDLGDKPNKTYKEILKFLEVNDYNFVPEFKIKNPNIKPISKSLNSVLRNPNSSILKKIYQKVIPKAVRKKIYFFIIKNNKKIKKRTSINKKLELKLKKEFKPEVEKLSEIINRDLLTLWDYKQIFY